MRKIILDLAVSLDGMIEGPNGEYDWCIMEPDMNFDKFLAETDAVFYGRKSYELFGSQQPETFGSDLEREVYESVSRKKKYVFSRTLTAAGDATIVSGNIEEEVKKIKAMPGKNIWLFGGASLVTDFVNAGLVDEYRLSVHPIVLGSGKPLFQDIRQRVKLKLVRSETFSSGVIQLYYQPE